MIKALLKYRSWKLDKLSPVTYAPDISTGARKRGQNTPAALIARTLKADSLYRCRIGQGVFYYADNVAEAVRLAVAAEETKEPK